MMLCFLAGCTSTKQIAYLQDTPENYKQEIAQEYEIKIHSDDLLSIMVNSKDLELVQMFTETGKIVVSGGDLDPMELSDRVEGLGYTVLLAE